MWTKPRVLCEYGDLSGCDYFVAIAKVHRERTEKTVILCPGKRSNVRSKDVVNKK